MVGKSRCGHFAELTQREENRLLVIREEARALACRYGFEDEEAHEAACWYVIKLWRREAKRASENGKTP